MANIDGLNSMKAVERQAGPREVGMKDGGREIWKRRGGEDGAGEGGYGGMEEWGRHSFYAWPQ